MFNVLAPSTGFFDPGQSNDNKASHSLKMQAKEASSAWSPRVFQTRDAIEDGGGSAVVFEVAYKVAMSLKLKALTCLDRFQAGFEFALSDF